MKKAPAIAYAVVLVLAGSVARGEDWFSNYRPLEDIEAKLRALADDRPDLVTLVDIGDSVEGRDIWALRISGSPTARPGVLFNGTQHAREWISPMVNMYIADRLVRGYDSDPQIRSLLDRAEVFVVPVVNPDGYVYTWTDDRMWRKNRRYDPDSGFYGVDLNRNWGAHWGQEGSSGLPQSPLYRGETPFSEPETAALRDFFLANPGIVANIDYHSYGQYILSPYSYDDRLPPDHDLLMDIGVGMQSEIVSVHGELYRVGPACETLYQISGSSIDWVYDTQGALAYLIELRPSGPPYFELSPADIIPTCQENLPAALYLIDRSIGVPEPATLWLLTMLALSLPKRGALAMVRRNSSLRG